jgi:lipopolysaccharide transport system ATP-binding protein
MRPIVRAERLGKQYPVAVRDAAYDTLRESLMDAVRAPFERFRRRNGTRRDTIWALRNASFEIAPGEVVGLIGPNGAGKSTLLKLLSRITEPTTGRAELYGRLASLLEVGTGFHHELTGRENIYLNGAILGMKKAEIGRKFDQIVEFAEVERFIDTPVKRYSSGMALRLAFAVASHLEPEVLVIDEVLAVGDVRFQRKCLGRMSDVAGEGRTILFVSHNMAAVRALCTRAIWLEHGEIVADGPVGQVVHRYLDHTMGAAAVMAEAWTDLESSPGNDAVRLHRVRVRPPEPASPLGRKTPFSIDVEYWNLRPGARLDVILHISTEFDVIAFATGSGDAGRNLLDRSLPAGLFRSTCHVPGSLLNVGRHRLKVFVVRDVESVLYQHDSSVTFEIQDLEERVYRREPGAVRPDLRWDTAQIAGLRDPEPV